MSVLLTTHRVAICPGGGIATLPTKEQGMSTLVLSQGFMFTDIEVRRAMYDLLLSGVRRTVFFSMFAKTQFINGYAFEFDSEADFENARKLTGWERSTQQATELFLHAPVIVSDDRHVVLRCLMADASGKQQYVYYQRVLVED